MVFVGGRELDWNS